LLTTACATRAAVTRDLTTTAERSGWRVTGRHAEAVRLCHDFAAVHPDVARCETFGTSPEGRDLVALIVGRGGLAPGGERPVVLVEAGIHAGEIEGKDATFALARDVIGGATPELAAIRDRVTMVFVPILNVDGHERFGKNHRPNQRGPEEMGFRVTAAALNLNRDFVKVDAPEMAALLGLWRRWQPTLFVDLHTTDGAKFEHDVAVLVAPRTGRGDDLERAGQALQAAVIERVTAAGHWPLAFYPSFDVTDDPTSGFTDGEAPPRFSHFYAATRNRLGVLVETHSWRTYPERVQATRDVVLALLALTVDHGAAWRAAAAAADRADRAIGGTKVALLSSADPRVSREIEFRGYRYTRTQSEVSGALWTQYDESRPEIWKVPLRDHLVPVMEVTAPQGGYIVEPGFAAAVAARLDAHGLRYERVARDRPLAVLVWRQAKAELGRTFEGRTTATWRGDWTPETRTPGPGALFVPVNQPGARLVLHLFEPTAPDSLAAWGFYNATLEQKEYLEAYVAEELARAMLLDPATKAAFDAALADPAFAASPERRLDWFYRRSPLWDERVGLLPVYRVEAAPPLAR
jgi:hypothetical protein